MARLNEPPAPSESVEAVKRRYLRQNRDLAKCNSNQSVRIRTLEQETIKLLADNIALREELTRLQNQIEVYQCQPTPESVGAIKYGLKEKMREIGALIEGLGTLQQSATRPKPSPRFTKKSPEERTWRNPLLVPEEMGGEAVLPTIAEGKFYPRHTLDASDIVNLKEGESPDLGPPPIAHFQDEDPIKFDPNRNDEPEQLQEESEAKNATEAADEMPASLSVNLETRRRRRDTSRLDIKRIPVFNAEAEQSDDAAQLSDAIDRPRAGAKRKLSVRDDDDRNSKPSTDDFKFTRRTNTALEPTTKPLPLSTEIGSRRKILGAKNANADVSPKKAVSEKKLDLDCKPEFKARTLSEELKAKRSTARSSKLSTGIIRIDPPTQTMDVAEIDLKPNTLPPKTPAVLNDLTSPTSTEPSVNRPETRDTPPPNALGLSTNDSQAGARPSRRARASVNYAEPNLVSKMRRPTADLAPAVDKDGKRIMSSTYLVKREDGGSVPSTIERLRDERSMVILRERESAVSDWKEALERQELASPLSKKTEEASRSMDQNNDTASSVSKQIGSAAAISALATSYNRTRKRPNENVPEAPAQGMDRMSQRVDTMAIYDLADSSPSSGDQVNETMEKTRPTAARTRQTRRHSSISGLVPMEETAPAVSVTSVRTTEPTRSSRLGLSSDLSATRNFARGTSSSIERVSSRRRSMLL